MNSRKILTLTLISILTLTLIPILDFEIPAVKASMGSASTPILIYDSIGGSSESYNGAPRVRQYYQEGDYLHTYTLANPAFNSVAYTKYSDDGGDSWGNGGGYMIGCDYNHKPFGGSGWQAVAFDEVLGVSHMACARIAASSFPYYLDYSWGDPNDLGVWNDYSYQGDYTYSLAETNHYGFSPGICLLDGKPVVAALMDDDPDTGKMQLKFFFSDHVKPYSTGNWTEQDYEYEDNFGDYAAWIHLHPVNSSHVLALIERTDAYRIFGVYASASGVGSAVEIIDEDTRRMADVNGWQSSTVSTFSDNILDAYAEAAIIDIAFVNTSNILKFASWDTATHTLSSYEDIYDDSGNHAIGMLTLAKVSDSLFLGWNGNRTDYLHTDFFISERDPNTELWAHNFILSLEWNSEGNLLGCSMSRTTYGNKLFCMYHDSSDDAWSFYIEDVYGVAVDVTFSLSASFEDIDDGGADWVFTDWKYYNFTATVEPYAENISIRFTLSTSFESVTCGFFTSNTSQQYGSDMSYVSREGEPCILGSTVYDFNSVTNTTTVVFPIWFESTILDLWAVDGGVNVYGSYNGSAYQLLESDFFRIYSEGGFTLNQAVSDSDAYVVPGSPFSFHCENGSSVYNEIWWRDVQHIKLMPTTHFIAGREEWNLYYGCDYSLGGGEWITGWWININPDEVAYAGWLAANIWINMTITFNDGQEIARVADSVYMYYHGSVDSAGDRGWYNMFIDLWFSDKNASSVTAARVNAYEYPMIDSSDAWLRWLASNWGVKDDELKELGCDHPLYDGDGDFINSEQISMVRYWSNLTVGDANLGQSVEVQNFDVFDATHSQQLPLVGISTPVFDETTLPTVGQKGLLGALFSMFSGVGQWLSENVIFGGLNLWDNFVNFLDTIAGMLGAPKFFTNLFAWLAEMIGYLAVAIGYLTEILTALFSLMSSMLGSFLGITIELIAAMVNTITLFTDMMGGAYGAGVNIWDTLAVSQWITLAVIFFPLYLVILWDEKGMDAVISQLTLIFGILSWVFNFLLEVARFVLRIITSIIESIPVAE